MKRIALVLLFAASMSTMSCSRSTDPVPVVAASPTPHEMTEEERRAEAERLAKKQAAEGAQPAAHQAIELKPQAPANATSPIASPP